MSDVDVWFTVGLVHGVCIYHICVLIGRLRRRARVERLSKLPHPLPPGYFSDGHPRPGGHWRMTNPPPPTRRTTDE